MSTVLESVQEERASICQACEHRRGKICCMDGAEIEAKASCLAGLWPETESVVSGQRSMGGQETSRRPRVGFVYPCWQALGGVEMHTKTLIANCPDVDWVGLVAMWPGFVNREALTEMSRRIPASGAEGLESLKAAADILIVWGFGDNVKCLSGYRGQVVAITHGCGDWSSRQLLPVLPYATRYVAVCDAAIECYPEPLRERVEVIHNGITLDRLAPSCSRAEARAEFGLKPDAVVIGSIGRISEEKNPLAAAMAAAEIGGKAVAFYVGDHHSADVAEKFMADAERIAPGRIVWIRNADHQRIGDYYRAMDVFVMASSREGGPLVSAEAWFCGVPHVATPVGMIPTLEQRHGRLTWSVPVNPTAKQLGDATRAALSWSIQSDQITQHARDVVINELSAARMGKAWGRLLTSMGRVSAGNRSAGR